MVLTCTLASSWGTISPLKNTYFVFAMVMVTDKAGRNQATIRSRQDVSSSPSGIFSQRSPHHVRVTRMDRIPFGLRYFEEELATESSVP